MKFVLTILSALALTAALAEEKSAISFRDVEKSHLDVLVGGKLVARYQYAYDTSSKEKTEETYKPYLHVFDAEGKAPITKGTGGEFPHHRGIFLGWNKLNVAGKEYDRWHMKDGAQIHQKFSAQAGGSFTSVVHWTGSDAQPILEEERTHSFGKGEFGYAQIDLITKLKAVAGDAKFGGDPEHAGIQFRPANEVDRAKTVYVFPGAEADPTKDKDFPWVGETYSLDGKTYSVVYLNHPDNPKGTVFSAYRDYGRFGGFFKGEIANGESLTLKVRFLIAEGEMPAAEKIQKAWNAFAGKNDPTPEITVKSAAKKSSGKPQK